MTIFKKTIELEKQAKDGLKKDLDLESSDSIGNKLLANGAIVGIIKRIAETAVNFTKVVVYK